MPTTQGDIFIKVQSTEVNMVMKFIYKGPWTDYCTNNAMCYIKCMASVHETSHSVCETLNVLNKGFKYDAIFCSITHSITHIMSDHCIVLT